MVKKILKIVLIALSVIVILGSMVLALLFWMDSQHDPTEEVYISNIQT